MLVIKTYEEFKSCLIKEPVISPWYKITQEQVNDFAKATLDHHVIYEDPCKTVNGSFCNATIIKEFHTLSLIPFFWTQMVDVQNLTMQVNYGIKRLKFEHEVVVDNEIRCQGSLKAIANLHGITKATFAIQLDIKEKQKPALTAEIIFLCHFR